VQEPTSPDDILGHKAVRDALFPKYGICVATGEHCQNRIMFKQLITSGAIDIVQVGGRGELWVRHARVSTLAWAHMLADTAAWRVCGGTAVWTCTCAHCTTAPPPAPRPPPRRSTRAAWAA
jgi:L-alanine-DL-glutamate epimerase-like enolase superfamily enzyme